MRLSGEQYERLWKALLGAFDSDSLAMLFEFRLERRLSDYVSTNIGNSVAFFKLIEAARAEGWLFDLVLAARDSRPRNPALAAFAYELGLSSLRADAATLQRIVRQQNRFVDVNEWRARLAELEPRVCRVDVGGQPVGTAFLVGPGAVLTNHHVVEQVIDGGVRSTDVTLRFDYRRSATGELSEGAKFGLATEWLIDSSPHGLAGPDELDYALLRVDGSPGDAPIGARPEPGAPARGWIPIPRERRIWQPNEPLYILQHPLGEPLKLALDTQAIIGESEAGRRVRYRTNTEPGSSGSPCFDADWTLVALHNRGDDRPQATFNEGIPVHLIRARIERRGFGAALADLTS